MEINLYKLKSFEQIEEIKNNEKWTFNEVKNMQINNTNFQISMVSYTEDHKNIIVDWNIFAEEISEEKFEKGILKKHSGNIRTLILLERTNDKGLREGYAVSFGQAFHNIKEYINVEFPMDFFNTFEKKSYNRSDIVYPFSGTNKTINSHRNMEEIGIGIGGFVELVEAKITGLNTQLSLLLTDSKKFICSNSIKFYFKINNENNLNNLIKSISLIIDQANLDKKTFLSKMENADNSEELNELLFRDHSDFNINIPSFTSENESIFSLSRIRNGEIIYTRNIAKLKNGDEASILETIKLDENIIKSINSLSISEDKEIDFICKKLYYFDELIHTWKSFNLFLNIDASISIDDDFYFLINGSWKKTSNEISNNVKKTIERYQNEGKIIDLTNNEEFNFSYVVPKTREYKLSNQDYKDFQYREIMYNLSLSHVHNYTLLDRRMEPSLNIEFADLYKENDGVGELIHVKFDFNNKDVSYNISQSISSMLHMSNSPERAKDFFWDDHSIDKDKIKTFTLLFALNKKEIISMTKEGVLSINNLDSRMILKLQIIEWFRIISSWNFVPKIIFTKMDTLSNDVKKLAIKPNK